MVKYTRRSTEQISQLDFSLLDFKTLHNILSGFLQERYFHFFKIILVTFFDSLFISI